MVSAVSATRPAARLTSASNASDRRLTESVRKYAANFKTSVAIDVAIESRAIFRVAFIVIFLCRALSLKRSEPGHRSRSGERKPTHYATCARSRRHRRRKRGLLRIGPASAPYAVFMASAIQPATDAGAGMRPELTSFSLITRPGVDRML